MAEFLDANGLNTYHQGVKELIDSAGGDFVITVTYNRNNNSYSSDKTNGEILSAYNAGKGLKVHFSSYNDFLRLTRYANSGSVYTFNFIEPVSLPTGAPQCSFTRITIVCNGEAESSFPTCTRENKTIYSNQEVPQFICRIEWNYTEQKYELTYGGSLPPSTIADYIEYNNDAFVRVSDLCYNKDGDLESEYAQVNTEAFAAIWSDSDDLRHCAIYVDWYHPDGTLTKFKFHGTDNDSVMLQDTSYNPGGGGATGAAHIYYMICDTPVTTFPKVFTFTGDIPTSEELLTSGTILAVRYKYAMAYSYQNRTPPSGTKGVQITTSDTVILLDHSPKDGSGGADNHNAYIHAGPNALAYNGNATTNQYNATVYFAILPWITNASDAVVTGPFIRKIIQIPQVVSINNTDRLFPFSYGQNWWTPTLSVYCPPNNRPIGYVNFNADPGNADSLLEFGGFEVNINWDNSDTVDYGLCPITYPYSGVLAFDEFKCPFTGYNVPLTITLAQGNNLFDSVGSLRPFLVDLVNLGTFDIVVSNKKEESSASFTEYLNLVTSTKRIYQGAYAPADTYPDYWDGVRSIENGYSFKVNRKFAETVSTYIEDPVSNKFITAVSFIFSYGCTINYSVANLMLSFTLTDARYADGTQVPFSNLMSSINVYLMFNGSVNSPSEPGFPLYQQYQQ